MRAVAAFAAAYHFPPSLCRNAEEAIGLLRNVEYAMSVQSAQVATGAGAVMSLDAGADLAERLGASKKDVLAMRVEASKQKAQQMRNGSVKQW